VNRRSPIKQHDFAGDDHLDASLQRLVEKRGIDAFRAAAKKSMVGDGQGAARNRAANYPAPSKYFLIRARLSASRWRSPPGTSLDIQP
jgi:hypothetical protein